MYTSSCHKLLQAFVRFQFLVKRFSVKGHPLCTNIVHHLLWESHWYSQGVHSSVVRNFILSLMYKFHVLPQFRLPLWSWCNLQICRQHIVKLLANTRLASDRQQRSVFNCGLHFQVNLFYLFRKFVCFIFRGGG